MTRLLVDTSVLIEWFHHDGEAEVDQARAVRDAHVRGDLRAHVLDPAIYEVGNVLSRALRWSAADTHDQLRDLLATAKPPLALADGWLAAAAEWSEAHQLSFYDAGWAATAKGLGIPLVSADRRLVVAGLAESPTDVASRLGLR